MPTDALTAITAWANALSELAGQRGISLPRLGDAASLGDLVTWARSVNGAAGAYVSLPPLPADADESAVLSWARSVDGAIRGFGISLPPLP